MASIVSSTFPRFRKLPLELQIMVWKAAAANLPVLDIQRFTAEITLKQMGDHPHSPARPLLSFTSHPDYINLTTGHRGLLRACRESRKAAQPQIDCLLPIHFLTTDGTGNLVTRQAFVPFNPSGDFCISGLGDAIEKAKEGRGARGSRLGQPETATWILYEILGLEGATTSLIKNLTIALDDSFKAFEDIRGWDDDAFNIIASRMPNLKTVTFTGEGILNRRHVISRCDFNRIHKRHTVIPEHEREWGECIVSWKSLWDDWTHAQRVFAAKTRAKISAMVQLMSQSSPEWGSAAIDAISTLKADFEMNFRAAVE